MSHIPYKVTSIPEVVLRVSDNTFIPMSPGNSDYARFIAEGGIAEPYTESLVIPAAVSMKQARRALAKLGHYTVVNDYIAALTGEDGLDAKIIWEFSQTVERTDSLTELMIGVLGLTAERADELFTLANTL